MVTEKSKIINSDGKTSYMGNANMRGERERERNLHLETDPAAVFGILHFGSALQSSCIPADRVVL